MARLTHLNHLGIDCYVGIGLEADSHTDNLRCRVGANYKEVDFPDRIR